MTAQRKVVVSTFLTLDGYMVGPDEDVSWVIEALRPRDGGRGRGARPEGRDSEAFLLGRVTYEIFAAYWPHAVPYDEGDALDPAGGKEDPRIIAALNDFPKYVFSTTLPEPEWKHRTCAGGGHSRTRSGGCARLPGSKTSTSRAARASSGPWQQADLIDEYHLYVHPVLLGAGKPLLAPAAPGRTWS